MTSTTSGTLAGKTAVVTGSTSGIGLGIATALAKAGANILLNGFGDAQRYIAHMESLGVRAAHHGADMSKPAEVEAMIAFAIEQFGAVDVLVNNAGIQYVETIEKFPAERWDAIIAINLSATFHAMRAALPTMRQRGWGRVINIASVHGLVASVGKSAYVAAKHGVVGLTKVAALETARSGVTVNAICPGWVLTPLVQEQIDALATRDSVSPEAAVVKLLGEKQPSAQFVTPQQIGDLAVFLCSDAASEMRGAEFKIDGGWIAQ
ncbi:MAG: 3-hydroxybutyrate dehydrogenase [Cupriavidus sp.]|nr:3-hydroxybutyrate dehydrogenase [Cupriavidus sp.]